MRIAIMGAGGVGGYFGARLSAAGEDVTFIARGAHLAAIRANGLRVTSGTGDLLINPAAATDDPASIGTVDIVMFCVKLWDTVSAAEQIRPLLHDGTGVISFQNGVFAEDSLSGVLGAGHVIGGVAAIAAVIGKPGVVQHTGTMAQLEFGELDNRTSDRVERFLAVCKGAQIRATVPDDIQAAIWRKFVLLSSFSALTCLCRSAIGPIREDPLGRALLDDLFAEAAAVARAEGAALPDDLAKRLSTFAETVPATMKSSMLQDLERGNRLEVDYLSATITRLGERHGIDTPCHRTAWRALNLHAAG